MISFAVRSIAVVVAGHLQMHSAWNTDGFIISGLAGFKAIPFLIKLKNEVHIMLKTNKDKVG